MEWTTSNASNADWRKVIINLDAKERVAKEVAVRLRDGEIVGVGGHARRAKVYSRVHD